MQSNTRRSVITSDKQNSLSAERESNLFSRVMIQTELKSTLSHYKFISKSYNFQKMNETINKAVVSC